MGVLTVAVRVVVRPLCSTVWKKPGLKRSPELLRPRWASNGWGIPYVHSASCVNVLSGMLMSSVRSCDGEKLNPFSVGMTAFGQLCSGPLWAFVVS